MTDKIKCPSCDSGNTEKILKAKDFLVSGEKFTIYSCRNCTLRFTADAPGEKEISNYYASSHYISHTDTRDGLINKAYHFIRKYALKQKRKWVENATGLKNGHLLDIGSGTGAFLQEMKTSGWEVTGLEPNSGARSVAQKQYQIDTLLSDDLFRLPENDFHAITLWHVLEHVYPLHEYLKQLHLLLRDSGILFIALPNYTSYDAKKYDQYWAAYDVPRHLYHFSPEAFLHVVRQHQFRCTNQIAMPFDAFYISLLSVKYKHGKNRYARGYINGLRAGSKARNKPSNASAILYVLQKES